MVDLQAGAWEDRAVARTVVTVRSRSDSVRLLSALEGLFERAPDMTAAERLVLVLIAALCPVPGQAAEVEAGWLGEWTGMSPTGVRRVLQRLAARGWELRVPLGYGRDGRPYYSERGQPVQYRLPEVRHG